MTSRLCFLAALLPFALAAQDTTAAKASLLAADHAAAATPAGLRKAMAPRAAVLLPNLAILHGAAAYRPPLAAVTAGPARRAAWTPAHAVVSTDGGFGCTTGVMHVAATDSTHPSTGRYAACWRRARSGTWRMIALSVAYAPPTVRALPDSIVGVPGSTGATAPPRSRPARAMADADRAFARFSADSGGPAGAFARWIAADGMMLGARPAPVRGPDQVRQAFAAFPPTGRFEWGPIDSLSTASRDGSLGLTIGEARIAPTPTALSYSKYLTVWRREGDGTYKFIFDIGSDRPAPTAR